MKAITLHQTAGVGGGDYTMDRRTSTGGDGYSQAALY